MVGGGGWLGGAAVHDGSGLDPSTPLLYRLYQDRCLEPDAIYGWELDKREDKRITNTTNGGAAPPRQCGQRRDSSRCQ